jgi:flagellar biosynthesis activator protein FlaF
MRNYAQVMYESAVKEVRTGRELEAAVLRNAARKLQQCRDNWNSVPAAELPEALRINQSIWSILQRELLDEANPLPTPLKANLLKLSVIVDRQILDLVQQPEAEKLDLLVDINLGIAEGLSAQPIGLHLVPKNDGPVYGVEAVCA